MEIGPGVVEGGDGAGCWPSEAEFARHSRELRYGSDHLSQGKLLRELARIWVKGPCSLFYSFKQLFVLI